MGGNIDIQKLKTLFDQIISGSESINNEKDKIKTEDIDEFRNCLSLFTDFGHYVNSRIIQIVETTQILEETEKKTVGTHLNSIDLEPLANAVTPIPDITIQNEDEKPRSYDITKRKEHRKQKVKDYDKNICDEHTPQIDDGMKKTAPPAIEKKITFDCSICDHMSSSRKDIDTHVKTIHTDIKLKCGQCPFTALEQRRIQLHKQKDHQGFTFACTHCKFIATKYEVLKGHVKLEHEKVIDFECEKCGYMTTEKKDFKKHMKIVHRK